MKRVLSGSLTYSPGSLLLALLVLLLVMLYRIINRQRKMITINETGTWLYQYLIELGFNYYQAQLITAQAAHETGNFTSDIFKQNNNLFGMKYAKQKFAAGEKNGHAYYNTLEDSAKDFKIYYSLNDYNPTYKDIQTYIEALKEKKYFEAPGAEYLNGVKFFHNLYFGNGRA